MKQCLEYARVCQSILNEDEIHSEELYHNHWFVLQDGHHDFTSEDNQDIGSDKSHFHEGAFELYAYCKFSGEVVKESEEANHSQEVLNFEQLLRFLIDQIQSFLHEVRSKSSKAWDSQHDRYAFQEHNELDLVHVLHDWVRRNRESIVMRSKILT